MINYRRTVFILFAQWGVEDSVKDVSVASEVTSGIDQRRTDPMSICLEFRSAFSSIQFSIGMISLILLIALPGEDGRAPEIKMLARR